MERSNEITAELERLFTAFASGDAESMEAMTTTRDGLVFIGSDPGEWFTETGQVRDLLTAQAGAGIGVEHDDIEAYEEGTVGWAAGRGSFVLPDGSRVPFRATAVFHREGGDWRLVQEHASVPVSNEEAVGADLS